MRPTLTAAAAALVTAALLAAACGKAPAAPPAKDVPAPASAPVPPAPPASDEPKSPAPVAASFTGKLEKVGISIVMQGTHRLVEGTKTIVLLKSTKLDLSTFEGKTVTVTGAASATVEGNQTIVEVETIGLAR